MPYPKISIVFCTKCKWTLRSAWYVQELLQTFGDSLAEVSLVPGPVGEFKVLGYLNITEELEESPVIIWDRKRDDGFPDSKFLKQKVKALLFSRDDQVQLGAHVTTRNVDETTDREGTLVSREKKTPAEDCTLECNSCDA